MKREILILLFVSSIITNSYSQNEDCSCKTDLIFLDGKIRKTPPYKNNKILYEHAYSQIMEKANSATTLYDCHALLNTLLISLKDNHTKVYSIDPGATEEVKNSNLSEAYPTPDLDLDSLKKVLGSKRKEDIEGIYTREKYLTIGVYKSAYEDSYKVIVLDTETAVWKVGEIMSNLTPFGNNYLLSTGGSPSSKRLIAYTERVADGLFYFMGFQKDSTQANYSSMTLSDSTYYRKELSDEITYLKIGSFSSWYPTLSDAEKFYKSLEGSLNKSNLIVDLRNNGGGGDRNSDILYELIKDYAKENKVYVFINHRTMSNAEQFAYRLTKLKNCKLFGTRTNGTLAYEIKDSNYSLPCGNFIAVLTSKKHSAYLEYESQGIEPDVMFTMDTDWIEQLSKYIAQNN